MTQKKQGLNLSCVLRGLCRQSRKHIVDLCNGVHRARGCHFGLELAAGDIPGREKEPALADLGNLGRDKGLVLASKRSCKVEDDIRILVELLAEDDGVLGDWVLV